MSVVIAPNEYSFFNIDQVYDFLLSINMRPIVELSFMPTAYASGNETIFYYKGNITPPKDYAQWDDLITKLAQHLVDRYGLEEVSQWYFEVWNEPNCGFWSGNQTDYFTLLQHTYTALKSVSPLIRVGGPATCQSQWIAETVAFCKQNGIQLDFISTHEYPTDPTTYPVRDLMHDIFAATKAAAGGIPVIYTEFNSGLFSDTPNHDLPYAASFLVNMVAKTQGLVEIASYWAVSDVFEEGGQDPTPFHDMYGIVTNIGVPKPAFHGLKLLRQAGTDRVAVSTVGDANTTSVWATRTDNEVQVFITNFDYFEFPIQNYTVTVTVAGVAAKGSPVNSLYYLIDDTHVNPRAVWEAMGSPTYPTPAQIVALHEASTLHAQQLPYSVVGSDITFTFNLVPYSTVAVFIPLQFY
ncbi:xylanase, variant [Capsaspora owczarzaki ATCC 30864]|nr:xylanase [Capsaspora owczarzaki ATCC 30864]XP_011270233.1 xylanase, variant [Capsaspora owczarzaki ATCC 30864]|eukprot:XP_004348611.2 xylanase [Capsaspora owczarzaki ATCC 30864]